MSRVVFTAHNKNTYNKEQNQKAKKLEAAKVKNKLIEALDENEALRSHIVTLEALLTQSNYQCQLQNQRIKQLQYQTLGRKSRASKAFIYDIEDRPLRKSNSL